MPENAKDLRDALGEMLSLARLLGQNWTNTAAYKRGMELLGKTDPARKTIANNSKHNRRGHPNSRGT